MRAYRFIIHTLNEPVRIVLAKNIVDACNHVRTFLGFKRYDVRQATVSQIQAYLADKRKIIKCHYNADGEVD